MPIASWPGMSKGRGRGERDSTTIFVPTSAAMPTGTFTRKTLRHPKSCTRKPPMIGPPVVETPEATFHIPIAQARRFCSVKV